MKNKFDTLFNEIAASFKDEDSLLREFSVRSLGVSDGRLSVNIDGRIYGYEPLSGEEIEKVRKSFEGLLKHSQGRALAWLKKNSTLVSGGKKTNESVEGEEDVEDVEDVEECSDEVEEFFKKPMSEGPVDDKKTAKELVKKAKDAFKGGVKKDIAAWYFYDAADACSPFMKNLADESFVDQIKVSDMPKLLDAMEKAVS